MSNQDTSEPAPVILPEGCCKFSKRDSGRIRYDLSRIDFTWVPVYQAIARELLGYENDRKTLVDKLYKQAEIYKKTKLGNNLSFYEEKLDKKSKQTDGPMTDICPFSVLATFTLETLDKNKLPVAEAVCDLFDVKLGPPSNLSLPSELLGIPTLSPRFPRFYKRNERDRRPGDIDELWDVFVASAAYANEDTEGTRRDFTKAYDAAILVKHTKWNLTMGLYWSNPERFPTMERHSVKFTERILGISIPRARHKDVATAQGYLDTRSKLLTCFQDPECPFKSFPEFSRTVRVTAGLDRIIARP